MATDQASYTNIFGTLFICFDGIFDPIYANASRGLICWKKNKSNKGLEMQLYGTTADLLTCVTVEDAIFPQRLYLASLRVKLCVFTDMIFLTGQKAA